MWKSALPIVGGRGFSRALINPQNVATYARVYRPRDVVRNCHCPRRVIRPPQGLIRADVKIRPPEWGGNSCPVFGHSFPLLGHGGGVSPRKAGGEAQNVHGATHLVGGETHRVHGEAQIVRGETRRAGGAAHPVGGETRRVTYCDSPERGDGSPATDFGSPVAGGISPTSRGAFPLRCPEFPLADGAGLCVGGGGGGGELSALCKGGGSLASRA